MRGHHNERAEAVERLSKHIASVFQNKAVMEEEEGGESDGAAQPIHRWAREIFTEQVQHEVEALLQGNITAFDAVPEGLADIENARLNGDPPRVLQIHDEFRNFCDERGARDIFDQLRKLLSTVVELEQKDEQSYSSLVAACRQCCEIDNYDQAMSFEGSFEMFDGHDRSIIVKLLLAATDYDSFCSLMYEESIELAWDQSNSDLGGSLFVLGTQMGPEDLQNAGDSGTDLLC
jgi:hypothetical protein